MYIYIYIYIYICIDKYMNIYIYIYKTFLKHSILRPKGAIILRTLIIFYNLSGGFP